MNIADSTVTDFQKDGVVLLRGVFRDWVEPLSRGVAEVSQRNHNSTDTARACLLRQQQRLQEREPGR